MSICNLRQWSLRTGSQVELSRTIRSEAPGLIGVDFELYRSRTRSIQVDYRYHISDHYTMEVNQGIDNGLFTVAYSFRR